MHANSMLPRWILAAAAWLIIASPLLARDGKTSASNPPIYISFLWHMHQPIYWPYESIVQTDANGRYSYSVTDIHNQRTGPYTTWPKNAVQKGIDAGLPHFGAQVSFSGSLVENLNNLEANGNGNFQGWKSSWNYIKNQKTSLNNPRLDMVGFGYHHPLMGLIDPVDIARQIELHKQTFATNFPGAYSKGIFPPENAFSVREIPGLVQEGIQWALVDNIHFDRACQGYPFNTSGNLYEPNKADIRNPNPNDWVQLNNLWAPTQNSARWGRQPHYVQYIDPNDGTSKKIIAVPADRYMGNEDGRGGFGALNYESVMSQLESYNTDPSHPILIVLHHDGDNYGGGSESYYNSNFQNFVNWLLANPSRFVCTTIQDYLDMFPPDPADVIHIEDGSWSGADNGDPEFLKWNGDPVNGYSPDRNSWGVVTAAKNYVLTANQINPSATNTQNAWKYMLNAEASDYWYWDGSQNGLWDSHPTRACNQTVQYAQAVVAGGSDLTPPTIYIPQREPYNPGGTEWGIVKPSDFRVWTYVYDVSGLSSVTLRYRTDQNGTLSDENETYAGGSGVTAWTDLAMTGTTITPQTNPLPTAKAQEYSATIAGQHDIMVDYYVEATDGQGNVARSPIRHVWVGQNTSGGGGGGNPTVSWVSLTPTASDTITITVANATQGAKLHWGVNYAGSTWQQPSSAYWPPNTVLFGGTGPAVETPFTGPDTAGNLVLKIGPFNNSIQSVTSVAFVVHYNDGSYNNNSGQDYHIVVSGSAPQQYSFTMDGVVDSTATLVSTNGGLNLYAGWNGSELYVATQSAQSQGGDMFLFVADSTRLPRTAPWAKSGQVAAWKVFLGNESSNNWSGWFNSTGSGTSNGVAATAGSVVEGTVNLQTLFGAIPSRVYLAAAKYGTSDAGALIAQVPAGNGDGTIDPSELFMYSLPTPQAPGTPVPVAPDDDAAAQPLTLMFRWMNVPGAAYYHLQLATDSTFAGGFIVNDSSITDTQRTVFGLPQQTRIFWRVQAKNYAGLSDWSALRRLTTMLVLPPQAPALLFPADYAVDQPLSLSLIWQRSDGSSSYRLQVSADSGFATCIVNDSALTDTQRTLSGLAQHRKYYWRVQARNSGGLSPWSSPRAFTTVLNVPGAVVLVTPSNGAYSVSDTVIFRWRTAAAEVFEYQILAATDTAFTGIVTDTTTADTSATLSSFSWNVRYYWKVRAHNPSGWGPYSARRSFQPYHQTTVALDVSMDKGWNMVSNPVVMTNDSAATVYPGGHLLSDPFRYGAGSGYQMEKRVIPGSGYWMKFSQAGTYSLQGMSIGVDSIPLATGWNIIGSISTPVDTSAISTEPAGLISSNLFLYHAGYERTGTVHPGKAYWIKSKGEGYLILRSILSH